MNDEVVGGEKTPVDKNSARTQEQGVTRASPSDGWPKYIDDEWSTVGGWVGEVDYE